MKKVFSVFVVLVFVWYCTVPAFAVESMWESDASDNVVITPSGNVANNRITENIDGTLWTLESVSYSNGDCCFILYEGGSVAAKSYVDADQRTITSSTYDNGKEVEKSVLHPVMRSGSSVLANNNYIYDGYIEYTYGNGNSVRVGDISHTYMVQSGSCNINQNVQDATQLAGILVMMLSFPGIIGNYAAQVVMWFLGLGMNFSDVFISDVMVDSVETAISWRAAWNEPGVPNAIISGSKYVLTASKGNASSGDEYFYGNYYPVTSFTSHNRALAQSLYDQSWWGYDETFGNPVRWVAG